MTTISYRFRVRRATAAVWTSTNEVMLEAEMGLETDTRKFKFGDGTTAWNSLPYAAGGAVASVAGKTGAVTLVKGDVGLGNVDNTSDADKPVSTATQTALDGKASETSGTWTPAFSSSGTAPVVTYLNQSGTYRRVGKLMVLFGELYVDTLTPGTGDLRISGFPTAPENARYNGTVTVSAALGWTGNRPTGGYVHSGGSYATLTVDTSATSRLDCPATNLAAGALVTFKIEYALA